MKEILTFLGKLIGLGIIGIVGGTAWIWFPCIFTYVLDLGFVVQFASIIVGTITTIVTCGYVQYTFECLTDTN